METGESGEVETLIESLVANPHDSEALARAHRKGESDPQGYAYLLEQVGTRTQDPSYASHWLSEAANIWSVSLGDAHRAARVLMLAVDRDPTQPLAADRLAQLYRDKNDVKALVAMLDRRVRLLTPMLNGGAEDEASLRGLVAGLHEELGKLWNDAPLDQPRKAIDHYKRSIELDATATFAIFSVREIYKSLQLWDEAISMYALELAVESDPARRLSLFRDEAATRRMANDLVGVTQVLRAALEEVRGRGVDDPVLAQELAGSLLDRAEARAPLDDRERAYGADLLATLAEAFDGEHGVAYAAGALDLVPGHDRAMQLFAYYASATGVAEGDALTLRYHGYLEASPDGLLAKEARVHLAASYEAVGQPAQAAQVLAPLRVQSDVDRRFATLPSQGVGSVSVSPGGATLSRVSFAPAAPAPLSAVLDVNPKQSALEAARASLAKSDKAAALDRYLDVLREDPAEPEALSWVEDTLRTKRDYGKLRDVLWASARATGAQDSLESRKLRLREIAGVSESNLKDLDGAIQAWRQILSLDRGDEAARQALVRGLEKAQRWDDLANLYEQDASVSGDDDAKIQLEKKLATLHEQKRNDPLAAAEAWARIADLTPEDEHAVATAATLFDKAGKPGLAVSALHDRADAVKDVVARAGLFDRLGSLLSSGSSGQDGAADVAAAGRAYQRAAEADPSVARWAKAEQAFAEVQCWALAAGAAESGSALVGEGEAALLVKAEAFARAGKYLRDAGDPVAATTRLERACQLAPKVDGHALTLLEVYRSAGSSDAAERKKLATFLVARGTTHEDKATRVLAWREAATIFEAPPLADDDAAKASWQKVLDAEEDNEALEHLVRIAIKRDELTGAAALLRRMGALATGVDEKAAVALREAELLARSPDGVSAAVERYEWVLSTLDPMSRQALGAIAALEEERAAPKAAAAALERELALVEDPRARCAIGARLARNYEAVGDDEGRFHALEVVREADPEDFDTLNRLTALAETLERWEKLDGFLSAQTEVEADDVEIATLTLRRAAVLADKLERGDDALAALEELADTGNANARDAYVALGDRLGWRGVVASKLVDWWFPQAHSEARVAALVGAFDRFEEVGRDADAVRVGIEVLRARRDATLARRLEELAAKTSNAAAVTAAQEAIGIELTGAPRAEELVRQAEMRVRAGLAAAESVQHGETALSGVGPDEAEPLLSRLAALVGEPEGIIDLYERQVSRSRGPDAREKALTRAAQVAGQRGNLARARSFFDLAVSGAPSDTTLDALDRTATDDGLRRALAEALAHGGEGVRDGGRTRASFLRRAARIAHRELRDETQAFAWLTDALVAHADVAALDALTALADEVKAPARIDEVITRVLTEVFDGPLVRLLLARRAKVRNLILDRVGAAADLKNLHDLSPNDESIIRELTALLTEQGDHRAMIQLYEDQILRSKDPAVRAELGRKVAQTWQSELADPREAADAWRRVLRLKPGDEEATKGLDVAKTNMLRRGPDAGLATSRASVPPPPAAPLALLETAPAIASPDPVAPDFARGPRGHEEHALPAEDISPTSAVPATVEQLPAATPSVQEIDDLDIEESDDGAVMTNGDAPPLLEKLLGSTDPFAEADTTHTSIDVRLNLAAATGLETGLGSGAARSSVSARPPAPQPSAPAPRSTAGPALGAGPSTGDSNSVPSSRVSKPPPLPSSYESSEPPTSPGRRLDAPNGSPLSAGSSHPPPSDQAFAMTAENAPVDFTDPTTIGGAPTPIAGVRSHVYGRPAIPAEELSSKELQLLEPDSQDEHDVLVVDEFVEDIDDEYEDVAEPSKPHGPVPH